MGVSASLLLAAAGAILLWAVDVSSNGFNVHTAGAILLIVGAIGFVVSLFFWSSWGGFGAAAGGRDREVIVERDRVDRV